jgi:hypothetical protein
VRQADDPGHRGQAQEVEQMNVNNFIVRPKRKLVEKYSAATAWESVGVDENMY